MEFERGTFIEDFPLGRDDFIKSDNRSTLLPLMIDLNLLIEIPISQNMNKESGREGWEGVMGGRDGREPGKKGERRGRGREG